MSNSQETQPSPSTSNAPQAPDSGSAKALSGRSKTPQHANETQAALERWFHTLRQRVAKIFLRLFVRAVVVIGCLACAYLLGWWSPAAKGGVWRFAPMLAFPGLALGMWIYGKHIQLPIHLHRWLMLIPAGFFLATLRHVASWWAVLVFSCLFALCSILFHLVQRKRAARGERLLQTVWDLLILGILLTHLFIPRSLFAALFVFFPIVLLVVFYNFILERDRLLRAKALAIGEPPGWLNKANQLIPSTTYLLLLLPGLLFAEAMVFHASYQLMHKTPAQVCVPGDKANPPIPPKLRNWFIYTVTVRMKVKHCKDGKQAKAESEEVTYWEFGSGYSLTATLIRALLLFFYGKRLLLIYLLLMDSIYGIRVHRIGEAQGSPGASARLEEHREVVQRTLDSFPRAWAGFLVRGIQGRHGILDPVGGLLYSIHWVRYRILGRLHPKLQPPSPPEEAPWSRMVREEQLLLLGKMQDHAWALEAMIDLTSPAHSSTFRGKGTHLLDYPFLRPLTRLYFQPPEPEVRARIVHEIAALIARAVRAERRKVVLQDVETDQLTHEQVWTLRDRALLVLKDLLADPAPCIRLAAARSIDQIADLPRPIRVDDMEIWHPLTDRLGECIEAISPLTDADGPAADPEIHPILTMALVSPELEDPSDDPSKESFPDPFAPYLVHSRNEEQRALVSALGRVGIKEAVAWLEYLRTEGLVRPSRVYYALGLGEQANGRPHAGFAAAQELLMATCQHGSDENHRRIALKSLARIAFPQPLAVAFEDFVTLRRQLHRQRDTLSRQETRLLKVEEARDAQGGFRIEQRAALREAYRILRADATAHEALALETFGPLHDTFWSTLHYSAVVVVGAFMQGEGFDRQHNFSERVHTLSLEDIQGWDEFFANLPPLQDRMSWVAPFHRFLIWISEPLGAQGQRTRIQRFIELKTLTQTTQGGREGMAQWKELFALVSKYEQYLLEALHQFTECLRVRPTLVVKLNEGEQESWWRITLSGLQPWLQPLMDAPAHMEPDRLYLSYEQYRPLEFHPLTQVTWSAPLHPSAMTHGHTSVPQVWSYSLNRASELILRRLGNAEGRGYWRAVEHPGDSSYWQEQVGRLLTLQSSTPLEALTLDYLQDRTHAGYQMAFSRSRLREQDPLMIRRELANKLDNFLEHDRRRDSSAPSIFLLAGHAGMGHSTLLLQHARQQYQAALSSEITEGNDAESESKHSRRIVLFADIGLFDPDESLPQWLYRELHIALTPEQQLLCDSKPVALLPTLAPLLTQLARLLQQETIQAELCIYFDGFHEHPQGIELFAQALEFAIHAHQHHPWCRTILSIRQSYLEHHEKHPALQPYQQGPQFAPPEAFFYREQGGLHGLMMKLPPFLDEATHESPKGRSELERAFGQYYDYTDTSGAPRYRPLCTIADLEPFGMTRTLLARPSLLPVIMETYHQQDLPDDLQMLALFSKYLKSFSAPERAFFDALIKEMLFGGVSPFAPPSAWRSSSLLPEEELLDDPQFAPFIEPYKYGVRLYDELRARGILIRRWQLNQSTGTQVIEQTRHLTFTSHQLQEYLLFRTLWKHAPDWKQWTATQSPTTLDIAPDSDSSPSMEVDAATPAQATNNPHDPVEWLLALAQQSRTFRPLEGALMLLLLHLIEQHHHGIVAAFNDRSTAVGNRNRHILFDALIHLDPRVLTRPGGACETILQDLSANDLELIYDLLKHYKHRSLYPEVEALAALLLDRPIFARQLQHFPAHMTDLMLERADNRRQILGQRAGGQLDRDDYLAGREYYEQALQRLQAQTNDTEQQTRVLRYLAQYEMDTHHWEEAAKTLHMAWHGVEGLDTQQPQQLFHRAWIRHLQSALQRRRAEPIQTPLPERQQGQLEEARELGEEALNTALQCAESERLELLAQIYDNLGRIYHQLAPAISEPGDTLASYDKAGTYFEGSIKAKRTLHDYLGMAISYSGLGAVYLDRARIGGQEDNPLQADWDKAQEQYHRALRLNRDKLQSDFGVALCHQALATLYLAHPEHHGDGLASLVEALSAFARIKNTQGCHSVIQQLVKEIAKLPLQEMHRFLKQLVSELQHITDLSEWLLRTLWDEFAAVLGNRIPKFVRDIFAKFMQS